MAVPRAQLGGMFGSGYSPPTAHPIDIGGAIDAAVGGASSLIQNVYTRKIAEANLKLRQQQELQMEEYRRQEVGNQRDAITERATAAHERAGIEKTRAGEAATTNHLKAIEIASDRGMVPGAQATQEKNAAGAMAQVDPSPGGTEDVGMGLIAQTASRMRESQLAAAQHYNMPLGPNGANQDMVEDTGRSKLARQQQGQMRLRTAQDDTSITNTNTKANAASGKRTAHAFTVDGVPTYGSMEAGTGKLFDNNGNEITGRAAPFVPPTPVTTVILPGEAGQPAKSVVTHGTPDQVNKVTDVPGVVKTAAGSGSPLQKVALARAASGVAQMNGAHESMSAYEEKIRNHTADFSGLDTFIGMAGQAFTHEDPFSLASRAAAMSVLNARNPELATYVRQALDFAQGEQQITSRPSDYRTKLSDYLAQISAGMTPAQIDAVQNVRRRTLAPLLKEFPAETGAAPTPAGQTASAKGAPPPPKAPTHLQQLQQLYDQTVAKYGAARAKQELGERPQ